MRLTLAALAALAACGSAAPGLDTTCPAGDAALEPLLAEIAGRGIPAAPDTVRLSVGGEEIVVGWKNLLSGRQLTLSCAYRRHAAGWRLFHARVDEGTHALQVAGRQNPPGLVYRDAEGRVLGVVPVRPSTVKEGAH